MSNDQGEIIERIVPGNHGGQGNITSEGTTSERTMGGAPIEQTATGGMGQSVQSGSTERIVIGGSDDMASSGQTVTGGTMSTGQTVSGGTMSTGQTASTRTASTGQTSQTDEYAVQDGDIRVPEYQEELVAGKQQEQLGEVHVHKSVVEEQQTVSAPVTHEELDVERVSVHNQVQDAPADAFQERDINIPLQGEQLVAGKQVVEAEEVRLRKRDVTEQEKVSGTVRKEQVTVDGENVEETPRR